MEACGWNYMCHKMSRVFILCARLNHQEDLFRNTYKNDWERNTLIIWNFCRYGFKWHTCESVTDLGCNKLWAVKIVLINETIAEEITTTDISGKFIYVKYIQ